MDLPGAADPPDATWSLPAVVPQRFGLLEKPTLADDVALPARLARAAAGTGALVASHDPLVVDHADRVLRLDGGVLQPAWSAGSRP